MNASVLNLDDLVREHLEKASAAKSGRSALTLHGARDLHLRHTLIALSEGNALADHGSPGEATLQVLHGTVVLTAGERSWKLAQGDFFAIPDERHGVFAPEDAAMMLTVAVRE